jgi:hypothetical protein
MNIAEGHEVSFQKKVFVIFVLTSCLRGSPALRGICDDVRFRVH